MFLSLHNAIHRVPKKEGKIEGSKSNIHVLNKNPGRKELKEKYQKSIKNTKKSSLAWLSMARLATLA
jgi:hypothetical protein